MCIVDNNPYNPYNSYTSLKVDYISLETQERSAFLLKILNSLDNSNEESIKLRTKIVKLLDELITKVFPKEKEKPEQKKYYLDSGETIIIDFKGKEY